jgi:hypothetical protein
LHWLKSSTDNLFSTKRTVSDSSCDFTNVTNSSPFKCFKVGR